MVFDTFILYVRPTGFPTKYEILATILNLMTAAAVIYGPLQL